MDKVPRPKVEEMYKRKLQALGFPNPETFNSSDEKQFQNVVIWLEDQKIRRYKIEDREPLRNTEDQWNKAFSQYLLDLDCPIDSGSRAEIFDWLLGLAVQLEFSEKATFYTASPKMQQETTVKSNPLDNLDFNSEDFKKGVKQLAELLQVPQHPDHEVTLDGICNLVKEKLSQDILKDAPKFQPKGNIVEFDNLNFGFDIKEPNLAHAANALRYLFIHDLRGLQTKINECLVAVQALTANPKTDTKLGKVGR